LINGIFVIDYKGNCGGSANKQRSKCWIVGCSVSFAVVTVGLLLGMLPLFVINERLHKQLKADVYVDVNIGLGGLALICTLESVYSYM